MKAFYAYPSNNQDVTQCIRSAIDNVKRNKSSTKIHLWENNEICGIPLTDPIFENIKTSDIIIADITNLNFNVTFEIGYAIGLNKRVLLTKNNNIRSEEKFDKIGIFDTIGYQSYTNSDELAQFLMIHQSTQPIAVKKIINIKNPVYLLRTPKNDDNLITIIGRIKKARLRFKGYMPEDEPRLSAIKAIDDISASLGVIIPLLPLSNNDAEIHNIRAAFVAGLALAMDKSTVILQPIHGPAPLDVRDIVTTYSGPEGIADIIAEFALEVTASLQSGDTIHPAKGNFLTDLQIGDSVAENEFTTLGDYYLQTDQYHRASRGEVNLVVGRKGSGKTALFSQIRDSKRSDRSNIIVDLKPEGYQLIRLKEDVLDYLAEGAKTHLITALFEYIFYLEICYKVLEKDEERHKRDSKLYDPYLKLYNSYYNGETNEGDFSERLEVVSKSIINLFNDKYEKKENNRLDASEVTELIYKHNIKNIRLALSEYLRFKKSIWLLFDNLDKGWSSHGVSETDILILRGLIDAARKIQHQMQGERHDFFSLVFVRNDVYQLLLTQSSDYGKDSQVTLDWTDPDLLREVIKRRLLWNFKDSDYLSFESMWNEIFVSHYKGEETSQFLINHSLMRPRNLIKLIGHCRGFAVSMGRTKIESIDIEKGLKAFSMDLITEADQELTDVLGFDTNIIFHFIGEGHEFTKDQLANIFTNAEIDVCYHDKIIKFMIYYGFLGINIKNSQKFIFDVGYDIKRMDVLLQKQKNDLIFCLSPAFDAGLNL